jgi:hypothetical protein
MTKAKKAVEAKPKQKRQAAPKNPEVEAAMMLTRMRHINHMFILWDSHAFHDEKKFWECVHAEMPKIPQKYQDIFRKEYLEVK